MTEPNKVQVILAITPAKQVNDPCRFVGMVWYYRDLWARQSTMLVSLTSLVGECSHIKVTRAKKAEKHAWYWDEAQTTVFSNVNATISKDVVLAYPDYSKE